MSERDLSTRECLRVLAATLSYRAAKVLRDVPPDFSAREFGATTRTPVRILAHMGDLMGWGLRLARGEYSWKADGTDDWDMEKERFFSNLAALDQALAADAPIGGALDRPVEKLIQGPLADALTHVGQLAILRGIAGVPVRPESYARADSVVGRIGMDQAAPAAEFDGDASVRR